MRAHRSSYPRHWKVTRNDWLDCGWERLLRYGPRGINVQAMARELKVSKASFYHYFGTRDAYLDALYASHADLSETLNRTADHATLDSLVARFLDELAQSPLAQDVMLRRTTHALRDWIPDDPRIKDFFARVDAQRLEHMTTLFVRQGYSRNFAEDLSLVFTCYWIGFVYVCAPGKEREWRTLLTAICRVYHRIPCTLGQ